MAVTQHNTIAAADTSETKELSGDGLKTLLVTNHTGANKIFFRIDGTDAVKDADGTYVVPAAAGASKTVDLGGIDYVQVRLISAGTEDYSLEAR